MKNQVNKFQYIEVSNNYFLNTDKSNLVKICLILVLKLSLIAGIFIAFTYSGITKTNVQGDTNFITYNSSFNGERLKEAILDYVNNINDTEKEISILQTIPNFQFREDDVIANINDEGSFFKGNTSLKLEFYTDKDNKIIKTFNVPLHIKTFENTVITTKTLKVGDLLSQENIRIAKIETTNFEDSNIIKVSNKSQSNGELNSLFGKSINTNIIKGNIVLKSNIDSENTIKRGDKVTVLAKNGIVTVRTTGTALMDAKLGENIRIQRDGSSSVLNGVVSENKMVLLR